MKHLCEDDDILVVLTPASKIEDLPLKRSLHHDNIIQTSLAPSLDPRTFELPIENLFLRILKTKETPELSKRQKEDYDEFKYNCYDEVYIPGTIPMGRSNPLKVNENELKLGDSLFILFLRFVIELKKNKGGWVNRYDLHSEGIIPDPEKYQVYSRLRTELKSYLLVNDGKKDGKKFIQNNELQGYRISTHPDFITYDKKKLLNRSDNRIKELAQKLS